MGNEGGNGAGSERGVPQIVEALEFALSALSSSFATSEELAEIRVLLDGIRASTAREPSRPRIATYSQGMHGFGHIRRNATIAHALRATGMQPVILMIAEAWQAGAIPMPEGVDCVTLPGLRKDAGGGLNARSLDVSDQELIALRSDVIRQAVKAFHPDVLLVDYLAMGAGRELVPTLERIRRRGHTRCVLGLREVLQDPETVVSTWTADGTAAAMRNYYDAIWIYGDPAVFDPVREYSVLADVADKVRYTGYLDQRPRLDFAGPRAAQMLANVPPPPTKLALCVVGGGVDGHALAEAFVTAELPPDMVGLIVTGPYMPPEQRTRLLEHAQRHPRCDVLEFIPDPTPLIDRADRIVAMGGYNTVCEVLSFEKHALIVPRVRPEPEQWIRAERLRDLGLADVLHPDDLSPRALSEWLARDVGPRPDSRARVDVGGLERIPRLLAELLGVPLEAVHPAGIGGGGAE